MSITLPKLAVVVPCFNEQGVLQETVQRLSDLINGLVQKRKIAEHSCIYFVDDGSKDASWLLIEAAAKQNTHVKGIKLARNVGHQNALLAGLLAADGDAIVSIDADLQDDINTIESMVDAFCEGAQIVYGVRSSRETDTLFKRLTARGFYQLMRLMGVDLQFDHADFRLMGRLAVEGIRQYSEVNLFLRGIVPELGFAATTVFYDRASRAAGESKYPLRKMLALAIEGITSFSVVPLRLITVTGILVFAVSAMLGLWVLVATLFTNKVVPGWASTVLPIYFLGGIQILFLGILGEYMGKIYKETKRRPRYIIERMTTDARSSDQAVSAGDPQ